MIIKPAEHSQRLNEKRAHSSSVPHTVKHNLPLHLQQQQKGAVLVQPSMVHHHACIACVCTTSGYCRSLVSPLLLTSSAVLQGFLRHCDCILCRDDVPWHQDARLHALTQQQQQQHIAMNGAGSGTALAQLMVQRHWRAACMTVVGRPATE
jgi:hypothetical protein